LARVHRPGHSALCPCPGHARATNRRPPDGTHSDVPCRRMLSHQEKPAPSLLKQPPAQPIVSTPLGNSPNSQMEKVQVRCDNPNCLLHSMPVIINYSSLISKAVPTRRQSVSSHSNRVCLCSSCSKEYRRIQREKEDREWKELVDTVDEEEWFLFSGITVPVKPQIQIIPQVRARSDLPSLEQIVAKLLGNNLDHPDVKVVRTREIRALIVTSLQRE